MAWKWSYGLFGATVLALLLFGAVNQSQGQTPNMFVSVSEFGTGFAGPMVVEVVIIDPAIRDTDEIHIEPNVTINGNLLRMAHAIDGNWYGYFADVGRARAADQTAVDIGADGKGLNFGVFVSNQTLESVLWEATNNSSTFNFQQTEGVALSRSGGLTQFSNGIQPAVLPDGAGTPQDVGSQRRPILNHVIREPKDLNRFNVDDQTQQNIPTGQIGINNNIWPIVQLYTLLSGQDQVTVQYNRNDGAQVVNLDYNLLPAPIISLDKAQYAPGDQVLLTIRDPQLNIDPTDQDSWTFNVTGPVSTFYQAFDENGVFDANGTAGLRNLSQQDLDDLSFNGRGVLSMTLTSGIELMTNEDQTAISVDDGAGNIFSQIVTLTEIGSDSGIFGTYDEGDVSILRIAADALPGVAAQITYGGQTIDIVVVPEVSTFSLLIVSGFLSLRRRSA